MDAKGAAAAAVRQRQPALAEELEPEAARAAAAARRRWRAAMPKAKKADKKKLKEEEKLRKAEKKAEEEKARKAEKRLKEAKKDEKRGSKKRGSKNAAAEEPSDEPSAMRGSVRLSAEGENVLGEVDMFSETLVELMCPMGSAPGDTFTVETEHGVLEVTVPDGVEAGDTFTVDARALLTHKAATVAAGEHEAWSAAEAVAEADADAAAVGTKLAEVLPQPMLVLPDKAARRALFNKIDNNGNGGLSLAEIDKAVVSGVLGEALGVPDFDHKSVLMRAYKAADASHDGFIERNEFSKLLSYMVYFNNLWHKFEEIDSDHDRRVDATEFAAGCVVLGLELSEMESAAEFAAVDTDGGGVILFVEFCAWVAKREAEAIEHERDEPEPEPEQVDEAAEAAGAAAAAAAVEAAAAEAAALAAEAAALAAEAAALAAEEAAQAELERVDAEEAARIEAARLELLSAEERVIAEAEAAAVRQAAEEAAAQLAAEEAEAAEEAAAQLAAEEADAAAQLASEEEAAQIRADAEAAAEAAAEKKRFKKTAADQKRQDTKAAVAAERSLSPNARAGARLHRAATQVSHRNVAKVVDRPKPKPLKVKAIDGDIAERLNTLPARRQPQKPQKKKTKPSRAALEHADRMHRMAEEADKKREQLRIDAQTALIEEEQQQPLHVGPKLSLKAHAALVTRLHQPTYAARSQKLQNAILDEEAQAADGADEDETQSISSSWSGSPLQRAESPNARKARLREKRWVAPTHAQLDISEHERHEKVVNMGGWKKRVEDAQAARDAATMDAVMARREQEEQPHHRQTLNTEAMDAQQTAEHLARMVDRSTTHAKEKAHVKKELRERKHAREMQTVGLNKVNEEALVERLYDADWAASRQPLVPTHYHASYRSHQEPTSPALRQRTAAMAKSMSKITAALQEVLQPPQPSSTEPSGVFTIFHSYAHRGLLSPDEFRDAVRKGSGVTRTEIPNRELAELFRVIDFDHNGCVHMEQICDLIWGPEDGSVPTSIDERVQALVQHSEKTEGGVLPHMHTSPRAKAEEGTPPTGGAKPLSQMVVLEDGQWFRSKTSHPDEAAHMTVGATGVYSPSSPASPQRQSRPSPNRTTSSPKRTRSQPAWGANSSVSASARASNGSPKGLSPKGKDGKLAHHSEEKKKTGTQKKALSPRARKAEVWGAADSPAVVQSLVLPDKKARRALFNRMDVNGNGGLSLAEIDKAVVEGLIGRALSWPDFNHKPALIRAYQAADVSHDGFIGRSEFAKLLSYIVYFNNLWHKFEEIDSDHDRRVDATEFAAGCAVVGLRLSEAEAATEFAKCDKDSGGMILFGEFCSWCAARERSQTLQGEAQRAAEKAVDGAYGHGREGEKLSLEPQSPSPAVLLTALADKLGYDEAALDAVLTEHNRDTAKALTAMRAAMAALHKA